MGRVERFLHDLTLRWEGRRVLVIGHVATLWGLERTINGRFLDTIRTSMSPWQEGWEFVLGA